MVGVGRQCDVNYASASFWKDHKYGHAELLLFKSLSGRRDLFEGLSIWKEEVYRRLQGSYPVIFLSFADVKQNNCKDAITENQNNYYWGCIASFLIHKINCHLGLCR